MQTYVQTLTSPHLTSPHPHPLTAQSTQPNLHPSSTRAAPPTIPNFQPLKLLTHPHNHIRRLRQRILLSHARARTPVKRQVAPGRAERFPALRSEDMRVGAVDVRG